MDIKNNSKYIHLMNDFKGLRKALYIFMFLLICIKSAECVIRWEINGEFLFSLYLLSLTVGITTFVALLACIYGSKENEKN